MLRRTAALATAGAVALGGVALLVPSVAGATTTAAGSATSAPDQARHKRLLTPAERRELRSTGHVTVTRTTKKHGTVTVAIQRGAVTAVSATSISLRSKDGYTHSYAVTAATKVRSHKQVVPLSELKVGDKAQVVAVADTARRIRFR